MADDSLLSLARIQTPILEKLWRRVNALPAKVRVIEEHVGDDELSEALQALLGQPAWVVCSLLEAVLSERGTFTMPVSAPAQAAPAPVFTVEHHYGTLSPELVWSGETGARSCARATRYVIEDLFASVRHSVLIAGYSFYRATDLFTPLFRRAEELIARGEPAPTVRVILDCSQAHTDQPGDGPEEIARRAAAEFRRTCWSSHVIEPELRFYRPSADRDPSGRALHSMHAKCIVVDGETALVGSANFSNRGRDDRNLEVGALIRDYHFVQSLLAAWADVSGKLAGVS
jgi:phosphatidylserine/phosphatidylglycerophosphate/cardiolipin synthase-like enzyme